MPKKHTSPGSVSDIRIPVRFQTRNLFDRAVALAEKRAERKLVQEEVLAVLAGVYVALPDEPNAVRMTRIALGEPNIRNA